MDVEESGLGEAELDNRIRSELRDIEEQILGPGPVEELQKTLARINELIQSLKLEEEIARRSADPDYGPRSVRKDIPAIPKNYVIRLMENRRLIEDSKMLQQRARIAIKVSRARMQASSEYPGFTAEICAICRGTGSFEEQPCNTCGGEGTVLVRAPSLRCPRCQGEGIASQQDWASFGSKLCLICRGSGWVLTRER